jgi:hypothetical protein
MFVARINSRRCQKCDEAMSLRRFEPESPDFDAQTFERPKCFVSETFVISISGEADGSIAPSLASQATPPPRIATPHSRSAPGLDTHE